MENDGKFEVGNKAAEKWTLESAMELGNELIAWMEEDQRNNIFFKEFLLSKDIYSTVLNYLTEKYEPFSKLIKKATEIQEMKIVKYSIDNKLQPTMSIFVLKNKHDWIEKSKIDTTIDFEESNLSDEAIDKKINDIFEKRKGNIS